jgi:hypothetical protein
MFNPIRIRHKRVISYRMVLIRSRSPGLPMLVRPMYDESLNAERALLAGARWPSTPRYPQRMPIFS